MPIATTYFHCENPLDELRKLAAARDKKRDIAALTLNMAISVAGGPGYSAAEGWPPAGMDRRIDEACRAFMGNTL